MPEDQGVHTYEDLVIALSKARKDGLLTDEKIAEIAAGFNDPLSIPPPPVDGETPDIAKVQLIIRLARANARGELTEQRIAEILATLAPTRASERPVRDSMTPELVYEQAPAGDDDLGGEDEAPPGEEERLASEDDVHDVGDEELTTVERGPDTDPPPAGGEDG